MSEHLQQMQRLQQAGTLAGGIAHGLNNELTLILGNIELALDQLPAGYDVCDSLEHARSAASRCADMSRQLLSVSRDRRTDMTKMDVAASVIEAGKLLEYMKPPKIRVTAETEIGLFIQGNANQIRQALLELGANAFHAMGQGGELQIRASRHEGSIDIAVRDTGCGMTPSQQKRIFDGPSGLGLSTVQSIISDHDGLVGVESRFGQGTIFIMNFPAWQPAAEEVPKATEQ